MGWGGGDWQDPPLGGRDAALCGWVGGWVAPESGRLRLVYVRTYGVWGGRGTCCTLYVWG